MERRKFLSIAGAAGAGLAFSSAPLASMAEATEVNGKLKKFGIQLYTLRDDMPKDPAGVLKQVAAAGYKQVESFEAGSMGMFWNMGNKEFKKFIGDLGMTMPSVHCDVYNNFEKKVEQCAEIGVQYIIYAWEGTDKKLDDYKRFCDDFNKKGEFAKQHGMRFAFHNHDYSFKLMEGQYPQDVLMTGTDPSLVYYEMDMYWVVTAGHSPIEWIKKYPGRFKLSHVKDRAKNTTENADSCTLGTGSIDYAAILGEAKKFGMDYFHVEQEKYEGTTPLQCIKVNAAYMKKLKI
jgi:sugar phosphate isomerase/epimerase